jgi:polar amino acid transport system permease protein
VLTFGFKGIEKYLRRNEFRQADKKPTVKIGTQA